MYVTVFKQMVIIIKLKVTWNNITTWKKEVNSVLNNSRRVDMT